jgi:hypothetical protein
MKRSNLFFNQKEKNTVACLLAKRLPGENALAYFMEKALLGKTH